MKSRARFHHPDTREGQTTAARDTSPERRRECVLARIYDVLPDLYSFVQRQLAYRQAVADLVPGAVRTEQVIDHVVVRAYMASAMAKDDDIAVMVRRLALEEIHAHLPKGTPDDRPTILYFFESNGGGGIERPAADGPASAPEKQAENDAARRAFENSLAGMPAVWRHVMLLHHVDGLAAPAVAGAVGRSESDVRRMIGHASAYLRERLFEARDTRGPDRPRLVGE